MDEYREKLRSLTQSGWRFVMFCEGDEYCAEYSNASRHGSDTVRSNCPVSALRIAISCLDPGPGSSVQDRLYNESMKAHGFGRDPSWG